MSSRLLVRQKAVDAALNMGLALDEDSAAELLGKFYSRAAIVTHDRGTRRFGGYVLEMSENETEIRNLSLYDPKVIPCIDCYGTGHQDMLDEGYWIKVPCQTCHVSDPYANPENSHYRFCN